MMNRSTPTSLKTLLIILAVSSSILGANWALDFDGSNDYVNTDIDINHTEIPQFSFEAWVYPTRQNHTSRQAIFSHDDCCYDRGLVIEANSTQWSISIGDANWDITDIELNQWQHVAVVYDHSQTSAKFYLNGVEYVYSGSTNFSTSADSLYIGENPNYAEPFQGQMDEIRVWNDVRTATELQENMCGEVTGQSNLIAYYQITDGSGSSLSDNSSHSNTATLINMDDSDWVISGAAIGNSSVSDYSSPSSLNLASGAGDDVTINSISGSPDGVHVYRLDSGPNVTTPPAGLDQLSQNHYFGVFLVGGTNPSYTITYDYDGHSGITNESTLEIAYRDNNADGTWADLDATLNTTNNTLIKTGQTGGEYILGSASDNSLPVELSSFTAWQRDNIIHLEWVTESEVENLGFILEKADGDGSWQEVASYLTHEALQGQGSTTRRTAYHFKDSSPIKGAKEDYRLVDVSYTGARAIHTLAADDWTTHLPGEFALWGNYPNPFNPSTTIQYELAQDSQVSLVIYDVRGQVIQTLVSRQHSAGWYNVVWNSQTAEGKNMDAGIYYAQLIAGAYSQTIKMLYLK